MQIFISTSDKMDVIVVGLDEYLLIITSGTSKVITLGCYDTGISDHNIVYSVITLKRKKSKPVLKEVCN